MRIYLKAKIGVALGKSVPISFLECRYHSGFEPPADFRPPSPNPLTDMDPPSQIWTPYQTFLLSILCIIFGN